MSKQNWCPTAIKRLVRNDIGSSTCPVVVSTDKGNGYFKALGNREGPQVLACEFVGTSLASWMGIPTFEYCIISLSAVPEIMLSDGSKAEQGPGFITKAESGEVWDGEKKSLERILNIKDITRLVCLDTWTRNVDRYFQDKKGRIRRNNDNVFLSDELKNGVTLKAFDFTHAFTSGRDVTKKMSQDAHDDSLYGLFPEFRDFLDKDTAVQACSKLKTVKDRQIRPMIDRIPKEWEIDKAAREAWIEFLVSRAAFLSKNFLAMTGLDHVVKQNTFSFDEEE